MATTLLRILGVHGVGNHQVDLAWQGQWENAIRDTIAEADFDAARLTVDVDFALYDDIFADEEVTFLGTLEALAKLLGSGVGGLFRRRRGFFDDAQEKLRWTAGMVVQWVENESLRERTRARIVESIQRFDPHVIAAHSLGSLVCYDAFTHPDTRDVATGRTFISFGSQIGNPFVVGNFRAGRLETVATEKWYHVYDPDDIVFTSPIPLTDANFEQVDLPSQGRSFSAHSATEYLRHGEVRDRVWTPIAQRRLDGPPVRSFEAVRRAARETEPAPKRRALLVGIDDYPPTIGSLEGCVNDVYLFSAVLQERCFAPEDIRIVLDDRATTAGIRERLEWLVDGAAPGDELVFFYAGHGAQIPTYDAGDVVDKMDECLVPFDFDWRSDRAITDNQIYDLYSQLPYATYLLMAFDCCHAGGIHRAGNVRIRGLDPPDDIRHRMLKWDAEKNRWELRKLQPLNEDLGPDEGKTAQFMGSERCVRRLGRSMDLRRLEQAKYDQRRKTLGHHGPYLPIIVQACAEAELAAEYRDGATPHGVFTFMLARVLREYPSITFKELTARTAEGVLDLGYTDQHPQVLGPESRLNAPVPGGAAAPQREARKPRRKAINRRRAAKRPRRK